jgi:hypothetical protein
MKKNRMRGIRCRTSWQVTTKSISIKGTGCKSGGGALKAIDFTSGDLPFVSESRLRIEQLVLTGRQKSAEGVLVTKVMKARTVPARG